LRAVNGGVETQPVVSRTTLLKVSAEEKAISVAKRASCNKERIDAASATMQFRPKFVPRILLQEPADDFTSSVGLEAHRIF
jgi:hypothetical protein